MVLMQNLYIQDLQLFIAVADRGSINRAAEQEHLDQSSISRRIKSLEIEFDCQLFTRLSTGVSLTNEGKMLYKFVQDFLGDLASFKEKLKPQIRLGTYDSIITHIYPERFSQLQTLIISNDTTKLVTAFNDYEVNALIVDSELSSQFSGTFFEEKLFDEPYYLISSTPLREQQDLLLYPKTCPIHQKLQKIYQPMPFVQEIEFSYSALALVQNSDKATVLPESVVKNLSDFYRKKLDPKFDRHISYFYRDSAFSNFLAE